ncbi:FAD-dependent oxidoreductase [Candidatus Saccharibacteria bacterium]|nr:FAD-dependent oxidoreductase [Candidatus Saccharibacteria bacterium]MBQ1540231.1 FAD-dependent oxidoreductase [Candidatus Saccharibacteria bacterium]
MKKYDVAIVGAGVAGMTAAIYVRRAGKSVVVFEEKVPGGQIVNTSSVANWPGEPGISGADLSREIKEQMVGLSAELEYATVSSVKKTDEGFMVETDDGEFLVGAVILAMGTEPRKLSEKQMKDAGERAISYCATCDGALYKGKPVVVVGSGNTAKHEMAYLSNIASKVYHIHHDEPIPEEAVAVFVAIGRVPHTEVAKGLVDLDDDGYVMAGEDCLTSCPGVFVAGDCRTKNLRQLVTAAADGAVAGNAAVQYLG